MTEWFKKAGIRALWTFAEAMLGFISFGMAISEIPWTHALSVSAIAALIALLKSIRGLPELNTPDVVGDIVIDPETSNAIIEFTPENGSNLAIGSTVSFNVTGLKNVLGEDEAEEGDEDE